MAVKIALDAGHGGFDLGSTYQNRNEKDDNLRLTLAVGDKLEKLGKDVYYTRTEDTYDSPIEKARIANDSGADLFVSIHRNNSITPNTYSGAEAYIHNEGGAKSEIARDILDNLEQIGVVNLGVNSLANDAVLKRTQMPAILLEIGFINTDVDNQLFDEQLDNIADIIANAIHQVLDEHSENHPYTYRVLVAGVANEPLAQKITNRLYLDGYQPIIRMRGDLYAIMVGEIYELDQAVLLEQLLRILGYNTVIITEENS